eukprot:TRINITY_DN1552_c0_g1_i1.p2 TRINITY_DN1552_c0_g1~~TRINITY_DN1552_c0_g1_i1.p2  ORF type:complete len:126 (-),score=11.96 TRINITY_DN1552_c0_g1_i1:250-627(-)
MLTKLSPSPSLSLCLSLSLPGSFLLTHTHTHTRPPTDRNIYLGEVFGSFIAISNPTSIGATNVAVKVELQTPTQRTSLLDLSDAPIPYFESGQNHDYVVEHELKELGVHMYVVVVVVVVIVLGDR